MSVAAGLLGRWRLQSLETVIDGRAEYPFGVDAVGEIRYDASGWMAVQVMRTGRMPFGAGDPVRPTSEEAVEAVSGYIAYFGTYRVDEAAREVVHHLMGSVFPNWVGTQLRRQVVLANDTLTLSTPPTLLDGVERMYRVVWRREA